MTWRNPHMPRLLTLASLVATFLVAPEVASPAAACASQHSDMWLSGFVTGDAAPRFYMSAENETPLSFTVQAQVHSCVNVADDSVRVSWQTTPGTASAGSDYVGSAETSPNLNSPACPFPEDCYPTYQDGVPISQDSDTEDVTEHFQVSISTSSGRILPPSIGRAYIVDDDGPSRVAFGEPLEAYQQAEWVSSARIPVFRAGDASGSAAVGFTLTGAGPGDYSPSSGTINFAAGQRMQFLQFTLLNDEVPEEAETVTATLSPGGTLLGSPSQATFTILDEDSDEDPPALRFHHPRQGLKYDQGDYRLREMHAFVEKDLSGVSAVKIALRQRKMSGACRWWNGDRFVAGPCDDHRWLSMRLLFALTPSRDVYARRFPALPPSIGTSVRNYTAWTLARDGNGNETTTFERDVNLSTFEVRRG